jgi:hypothetical protein
MNAFSSVCAGSQKMGIWGEAHQKVGELAFAFNPVYASFRNDQLRTNLMNK